MIARCFCGFTTANAALIQAHADEKSHVVEIFIDDELFDLVLPRPLGVTKEMEKRSRQGVQRR